MPDIYTHQSYNSGSEETSDIMEEPRSVQINFLEGMDLPENPFVVAPEAQDKPKKSYFSLKLAKILAIVGILVLIIYFAPILINFARYKLSGNEVGMLTEATQNATSRSLPVFDPTLPKENRVSISSIGVDTEITEATYDDYESALKKGVWRVSDFGEPDIAGAPIILAAHRYGYLAWTNTFRHESSFYNLPKVKVGDIVTIDWQQREYRYGVYKTETGTEITDYSADLILYTCESLSGEERIFVYAKLIS